MYCAFKPISIANTYSASLSPAIFAGKSHHQQISIPFNPVNLHLSVSSNSISFLSLRKKPNSRSSVTFVAAQQDLILENENQENEISVAGDDELSEDAKVYVGNLPFDIDSEKLAHLFEPAGFVEISEVIYNRETDQSRGFGFVTMSTVEEAEKAVDLFHQYELGGRNLTVNKAAPKGSRPERTFRSSGPSYKLYVKNLSYDMDNEGLEQVFEKHGKVLDARVIYDRETGRSRGFGFVTMSSESEMNDAIKNLHEKDVGGRPMKVNVAEDRRKSSSF